jgi:hypothetical protein
MVNYLVCQFLKSKTLTIKNIVLKNINNGVSS